MNNTKILFFGNVSKSFVKYDYELLKKSFNVDIIDQPTKKIDWFKYFLNLIKKVKKCDITFSWFASFGTSFIIFFSKLFGKKSIVIVGGYDARYNPEINFGAFTNRKERIAAKYVYKHVDIILAVSPSLKDDIIKNAKIKGENIFYLPTCHDSNFWKSKGEKQNIVLTVALVNNMKYIKLKGFDTFVKSASYLKDTKFIVVGVTGEAKDHLKKISSENVELVGIVSKNELVHYYQLAKVYCQLSYSEGLPSTLCESMLCECIPVGSKIEGNKTVIGNTGFYVDYGNEQETALMIKKSLESKDDLGKKARERVKTLFSEKRRDDGLKKIISEISHD